MSSGGDLFLTSFTQIQILRAIPNLNDRQLSPLIGFASRELFEAFLEQVGVSHKKLCTLLYSACNILALRIVSSKMPKINWFCHVCTRCRFGTSDKARSSCLKSRNAGCFEINES